MNFGLINSGILHNCIHRFSSFFLQCVEKLGLHQLIRYMYTGRLTEPVDVEGTVTLLCLADRFAISSCMEPLANVLKSFPSTLSDCLLILGLPESLKADRAVQPVVEHCCNYLAAEFQACFLLLTFSCQQNSYILSVDLLKTVTLVEPLIES